MTLIQFVSALDVVMQCQICRCNEAQIACGRCKERFYCGKSCLEKDWSEGEHSKECEKIGGLLEDVAGLTHKRVLRSAKGKRVVGEVEKARAERLPICSAGNVNRIGTKTTHPGIIISPESRYLGQCQIEIGIRKTLRRDSDVCESGTPIEYEFIRNFDFTQREFEQLPKGIPQLFPVFQKEQTRTNAQHKTTTTLGKIQFPTGSVQFIDNAAILFGQYRSRKGDALPSVSRGDIYKYIVNSRYQYIDQPSETNAIYFVTILVSPRVKGEEGLSRNSTLLQGAIPLRQIPYTTSADAKTRFLIRDQSDKAYAVVSIGLGNPRTTVPRRGVTLSSSDSVLLLKEVSIYYPYRTRRVGDEIEGEEEFV